MIHFKRWKFAEGRYISRKRKNVHLATRSFVFVTARKPKMLCFYFVRIRSITLSLTLSTAKFKQIEYVLRIISKWR